jgi:bifunctional NMN adenylyltransferase/nudix hydrolase
MKKYDYLVFIGRFQPFHFGHAEVIERALSLSDKVIVLAGSANAARSLRNPFTLDERYTMIKKIYPEVIVRGIDDHTYNDSAWIKQVHDVVKDVVLRTDGFQPNGMRDYKIGLVGCNKDHSSYYLKLFPEWANETVEFLDPINATAIRKMIYEQSMQEYEFGTILHKETAHWLTHDYVHSHHFERMKYHHDFVIDYKQKWGEGPFLTADALVEVGGHVLLVTRGAEYGQGLLALPGGFKNKHEKLLDAALRELKEETKIKVPLPVLKGSIVGQFLADDPYRSERGEIVSMVQHIKLENDTSLPKIHGSDDAEKAEWWNLADIEANMFFEDHYHIIKKLTGI